MVKRSTDQKLRLRNFDARHERIETEAAIKNRKGIKWYLKRKEKEFAISGKQEGSAREETNAVSGTTVMTPKTVPLSDPPTARGTSASKKKKNPRRQESVWEDQWTAVQKLLERYLH